ncbi:Radical S-adenosyl methionine domain-containing protein 2 [Cytospora mali]|uniref:Radical S-adenosyl methionine domain-containing protein 2 n=1 Tax=Cytospora mali TaxID=578113 RepID=A0A194V5X5_CYTMA|nr:Radical S-adenosyl methionine domain-containing protein 2 [Valsa mali var. pyri (nom. inval.)]
MLLCVALLVHFIYRRATQTPIPISVSYHITRVCNLECKFCFHTAKTSNVASLEDAKQALAFLKHAGMKKVNFAGGEPFGNPNFLRDLVQFAKQTLKLESVSIVSNGRFIREPWLRKYGPYLDILAISCDSFNEKTNIEIGRGKGDSVKRLFRIRDWCHHYGIKFKLNTVVCRNNFDEDMVRQVTELNPFRWKCFQVLRVEGENDTHKTLKDVRGFEIENEEFEAFCRRHEHLPFFVPESNQMMAESYLLLDENLRFISGVNKNITSKSILDVGVHEALRAIHWDQEAFIERGGLYEWTKDEQGVGNGGCGSELANDLQW